MSKNKSRKEHEGTFKSESILIEELEDKIKEYKNILLQVRWNGISGAYVEIDKDNIFLKHFIEGIPNGEIVKISTSTPSKQSLFIM